jgi:ABC-type transport system involved in multi-copper enzyme maturation permease subunit
VLFNLKRIAPYALAVIFSANALLWWGWGPAIARGWATNSDFYIVRLCGGFSFMTLPLFIALMMGDPVIRDFRIGIDPLIFSKPLSRASYLLGKFCGNFFVLFCCQAAYILTLFVLQAFGKAGMITLSPRLLPYLQHFLFFTVVSSLAFGAVCFTVGTLTRNVKIVYGLAVSFYVLYIAWQESIKGLAMRWRILLDPLLFNFAAELEKAESAVWLNRLVISYDGLTIANRLFMLSVTLICLGLLYLRFSSAERAGKNSSQSSSFSLLNLAPPVEWLYQEAAGVGPAQAVEAEEAVAAAKPVTLPQVSRMTKGWRAGWSQFAAALGVEFRLLRAERSLIVVAPLIMLLCAIELAAFELVPQLSYAATYAGRTADALLLLLFGIAVFYTGETMHRDRELGIEPVLWSTPAPNTVILLSKFTATLLLSLSLVALVALTVICLQLYKGHAPLEPGVHLKTYALITVPSVLFMIAASTAVNVLLRDKYLAYAVSLAVGGAVYYLAGPGRYNWLYNPVLYKLWTPGEIVQGGDALKRILIYRLYDVALAGLALSAALLFFERKNARGWKLRGNALAILAACASAALAGLALLLAREMNLNQGF